MRATTAWIAARVLSGMRFEAAQKSPRESGGVLLGFVAESGEPVVTHSIGPGPKAVHSAWNFIPDYEYQLAEIARLYEACNRQLEYLGDWHTHPGGVARLSEKDLSTLRRIARHKAARASRPLMVILAPGPEWNAHGWQIELTRKRLGLPRAVVRPLDILSF